MKMSVIAFFILSAFTSDGLSQWKEFGLWRPKMFGVHDTTLFASRTDGGTYRHGPSISSGWTEIDTGFISNYKPRSFGSIGSYVLATAYRSSDNGLHWVLTKAKDAANCFLTLDADIYFGGSDVWKSTDSGMNWTASVSGIKGYTVSSLAYSNTRLFAATPSGVFRSTDSGQSWQLTNYKAGANALAVLGLRVFAASDTEDIYFSDDYGESWKLCTMRPYKVDVRCLVTDGKNLFAGSKGVFFSIDSGLTWDTSNSGLPWINIFNLCVFDTLLVANVGQDDGQLNYTYVRPLSEIVNPKSAVAEQPVLNSDSIAIYPNPTANNITVRLGTSMARRIEVLNVLGASLQSITPRESEVTIDLSNLQSGTYFILIESPKGEFYRKIIRE